MPAKNRFTCRAFLPHGEGRRAAPCLTQRPGQYGAKRAFIPLNGPLVLHGGPLWVKLVLEGPLCRLRSFAKNG